MNTRPKLLVRPRQLATLVLVTASSGLPCFGQTLLAELPPTDHFPPLAAGNAVVTADFDGDGIHDVVVGGSPDRLYLGDGRGAYTEATSGRLPASSGRTSTIALHAFDADGDGDQDLLLGSFGQFIGTPTRFYRNVGSGRFVDETATQDLGIGASAIASGDLDGDGDLDLVLGTIGTTLDLVTKTQNRIFLNDGTGAFTDATTTNLPVHRDVAQTVVLVDVDGDGDLDLVVGSSRDDYGVISPGKLYENDGTGRFTDVTAAQLPAGGRGALATTDFDGDGDADLVFGQSPEGGGRLFENDGRGTFRDVTSGRLPAGAVPFSEVVSHGSIVPDDIDLDGDEDLYFGRQVFVNDGAGRFSEIEVPEAGRGPLALADADGNGLRDPVYANGERLLNGGGFFARTFRPRALVGSGWDRTAAVADLDGDGDADVVLAEEQGLRLHFQDGEGVFTAGDPARLNGPASQVARVALGDIDMDGDVDLVMGTNLGTLLYANDGGGRFTDVTSTHTPPGSVWNFPDAAFGDVDGDGDLDLFFAGSGVTLWLNDGTGRFTDASAQQLPAGSVMTQFVALVDVDQDGDIDAVLARHVYLNDGTGHFVDEPAGAYSSSAEPRRCLATGDFDGDGNLDLVVGGGRSRPTLRQSDRLYLGDGQGAFVDATATHLPSLPGASVSIAVGDLDEDGDLDLVMGHSTDCARAEGRVIALENDGSGRFHDGSTALLPPTGNGPIEFVLLTDLDQDEDLDLISGGPFLNCVVASQVNGPGPIRVLANRLRQLRTPLVPRLGEDFEFEIHAGRATSWSLDTAIPLVSSARSRHPIAGLGTLGLDPANLVTLAPVLVDPASGSVRTTIRVPSDVQLAGVEIFSQALVLRWPNEARFTNVTRDRILR